MRLRNKIWIAVLSLLIPVFGQGADPPGKPTSDRAVDRKLEAVIGTLQAKLSAAGIDTFYIGGGSARSILDHLRQGEPLDFRDLDIFVVWDRAGDPRASQELGRQLQHPTLGQYLPDSWHVTRRLSGDPNPTARDVGHGFVLRNGNDVIDVSLFGHAQDLSENGVFDVDTVLIPLGRPQDFRTFVDRVKTTPRYEDLLKSGAVRDPYRGYPAWRQHTLRLVHWNQVIRDPLVQSVRLVRSYGKRGPISIPKRVAARLGALLRHNTETSLSELARSLQKVLADRNAEDELVALSDLGVFTWGTPPVAQRLRAHPASRRFPDVARVVSAFSRWASTTERGDRPRLCRDLLATLGTSRAGTGPSAG